MREILFRGQRTDNKKWVYGYYTVFIEGIRKNHCIISENKDAKGLLDSKQIKYYVIPKTVGQFTGLLDKKIFEGDILKVKFRNRKEFVVEVYYDNIVAQFKVRNLTIKFHYYNWLSEVESKCEVIGNIFENPELVKG